VNGLVLEYRPVEGREKKNVMIVISVGPTPNSFMPASTEYEVGGTEHRSEHHAGVQGKVIWQRAHHEGAHHQTTQEHTREIQNQHLTQTHCGT